MTLPNPQGIHAPGIPNPNKLTHHSPRHEPPCDRLTPPPAHGWLSPLRRPRQALRIPFMPLDAPITPQPAGLNLPLYDYQLRNVHRMKTIESNADGGYRYTCERAEGMPLPVEKMRRF